MHHVWNADITLVPTFQGFWVPWLPHAVTQLWPFCWHVAVVVDHFSRAVIYAQAFPKQLSAEDMCHVLSRGGRIADQVPKYIVTDQGSQFRDRYRGWCEDHDVLPRFGAIGRKGSIALIERFMRTMKSEGLRCILIPMTLTAMNRELAIFARWYNVHRPHRGLGGSTPAEVRDGRKPARGRLSYETRPQYPLRGKITERRGIAKVQRVAKLELVVGNVEGREHLPIIELRAAA